VRLKRRDVHLLHNLSLDVHVAPRHVIQRGDAYERVIIGTGPFKVESNNFQKQTDQVRNPDYWQSGKPYLDRLTIQFGLDQSGEMAGFIAKQLDLIQPADQVTVDTLKQQVPDAQVAHFVQNLGPNFALNSATVPAFKDQRVRRALHLAVSRQQIDQVLSGGHGLINPPATWGLSPFAIPQEQLLAMPGYRKDKQQDLADAKALLAAAGFGSGLSTSVIYQSDLTTTPKVVEVMAENLRSVGVTLNLKPVPSATFIAGQNKGDYEISAAFLGNAGELTFWQNWLRSGGGLNKGRVNDPDLDRLIDAETQELDSARRKQIWLDIQRILLDQAYMIGVPEQANFAMWQSRVHNYHYGRSANIAVQAIENVWVTS
jgi:peptide/nickel transport system substrate-binding protein